MGHNVRVDVEALPVEDVLVGELLSAAASPRRSGTDAGHVRALAEHEGELPPILVHAPTMRVIDGMHRLLAAKVRGAERIRARLWDGDAADSFVLAVRSNIEHGLPLSLTDRRAAAERIIESHSHWSDRMIAASSGLSPKTVASVRGCPTEENPQLDSRTGRDGRQRPVDIERRRADAARLITQNPGLSLRAVAKQVGIAPETVRQVRARLETDAGDAGDPGYGAGGAGRSAREGDRRAPRYRTAGARARRAPGGVPLDLERSLRVLSGDPALRSTESGRILLRSLATSFVLEQHAVDLAETIPLHNLGLVAAVADANAAIWSKLAELVAQRSDTAA